MDQKNTMSNEKDIDGTLYHIKVKGNLDPKWADWFDGLVLTSPSDGETLLSGKLTDQAALHGILNKINRLGLLLILVAQVDGPYISNYCPLCGRYKEPVEEPFNKYPQDFK
jgi:hypothetical protein